MWLYVNIFRGDNMNSIQNIGALLKVLRQRKKLTQIEVANSAGIAVNSLRLYENNKRQPRFEQLIAILEAMGATMGDLLALVDTVDTEPNIHQGLTALFTAGDVYRSEQLKRELNMLFDKLNLDGKEKAVETVKIIEGNPEFQRTDT